MQEVERRKKKEEEKGGRGRRGSDVAGVCSGKERREREPSDVGGDGRLRSISITSAVRPCVRPTTLSSHYLPSL